MKTKTRIRTSLILILIILINLNAFSQETIIENRKREKDTSNVKKERVAVPSNKYLPFGIGLSIQKAKDLGNSPLLYKGLAILLDLGFISHSERRIHKIDLLTNVGSLYSRNFSELDAYSTFVIREDFSYTHLRNIKKMEVMKMNWYLGGKADIKFNARINRKFENSAFAYDGFISLSLTTRLEKPVFINDKERFRFSLQPSISLVSVATRPNYVFFADIDKYFDFSNTHITSLNDYFNINNLLEISYVLKNGNIFRMGYLADFYSYYPGLNNVKAGMHCIIIATHFKFN